MHMVTKMLDWKYGKFKLLILLIYFINQVDMSSGYNTSVEFVIKNIHCGKYVVPRTSNKVPDNDPLVMWDDFYTHTRYRFEPVDGIWGYIREVKSNKLWHTLGGSSYTRKEGTHIVLWPTETRWALFAIDQVNKHIIHRDGQLVEYEDGYDPYPPNGDPLELSYNVHQGMNWVFLNPQNLSETIYPYGPPTITGEWELIFAVEKPLATQTWEYVYKLGKSHTKSESYSYEYTSSYEFTWERSGLYGWWGYHSGYSHSSTSSTTVSRQIESASEDTWYGETQETSTVTVEAGTTVAVWQRIFIGEQLGHKVVYQSNHFSYTNDTDVKPE